MILCVFEQFKEYLLLKCKKSLRNSWEKLKFELNVLCVLLLDAFSQPLEREFLYIEQQNVWLLERNHIFCTLLRNGHTREINVPEEQKNVVV